MTPRGVLKGKVYLPFGLGSAEIPEVGQPGELATLADLQEGDYAGAAGNALLLAADAAPLALFGKAVLKGNKLMKGSKTWGAVRKSGGNQGIWLKDQQVHHSVIPQGRWGKKVDDSIKRSGKPDLSPISSKCSIWWTRSTSGKDRRLDVAAAPIKQVNA